MYTHSSNRNMVHLQGLSALLDSSALRRTSSYQSMGGLPVCSHSSNRRLATCPFPCLWARAIPLDMLSIRYSKVSFPWRLRWPRSQRMEDLQSHRLRHPASISQSTEDLHPHRLHKPGLLLEAERRPSAMLKQLAQARSKPSPCMSVAQRCRTATSKLTTTGSATCGYKRS